MISLSPRSLSIAKRLAASTVALTMLASSAGPSLANHLPVDSDPDVVGPVIESFGIAPAAVDVRVTSQIINAAARLTDDKSGVADVRVNYRSPSGAQGISFRFTSGALTAGDAHVGDYATVATIDTYRESGVWQVSGATTTDVIGNTRSYTAAEANALGAIPFDVQSSPNPDLTAPEVVQVRVSASPLDVSGGDGFPSFEWDATDSGGSGVVYVNIRLTSPSGRQAITAQGYDFGTVGYDQLTFFGDGLTSTSTPTGNYFENGVSRYAEPGIWAVNWVQVRDRANNQRTYQGADLDPILATAPFLEVNSVPTDTGLPAISAFRFSPASIDVSTAPATVTVQFDVTDELSGVQAAWLTFRSPTIAANPPFLQRTALFHQYLTAGRVTGGTVQGSVTFPTYDRGGDWTVVDLCVVDRVKHQVCYSGADLGSRGSTTVTVVANEAPSVALSGVTDGAVYSVPPNPSCAVTDREDGAVSGIYPVISGPGTSGVYSATCSYTDSGGKTTSSTATYTVLGPQPGPDTDGDGVADETDNCAAEPNVDQADLDQDGLGDACDDDIDGDGLSNVIEIWLGCDPHVRDTDGDGVWDLVEVLVGTNPLLVDSDRSGEGDGGWLLRIIHDECGCSVGLEDDTNGNGVFDVVEYYWFGSLYDPAIHGGGSFGTLITYLWHLCGCGPDDLDGSGIPQTVRHVWGGGDLLAYIIRCGCTPWDDPQGGGGLRIEYLGALGGALADDPDGDGVLTVIELLIGCNPYDPDTDGDRLSDHAELFIYGTNPLDADTDGDGMRDGREIELGCNPNDPDTDGDGTRDGADPAPLGYIAACAPSADQPVVPIGTSVQATATFGGTVVSGSLDWGDGSPPDVFGPGAGSRGRDHVYRVAGVYTLTCSMSDGTGGTADEAYRYVVVFDPSGGFVTGGGWITSPPGAYAPDPAISGKATFGFVSKYHKGAQTPSGNAEFQFKAGDLNFHSSSYDWLVIAGARAQFRGAGTINGAGNYGFILTGIDGQLGGGGGTDRFRIKIWAQATGQIVYDNQVGAEDGAEVTTNLGAGSIVIHKG